MVAFAVAQQDLCPCQARHELSLASFASMATLRRHVKPAASPAEARGARMHMCINCDFPIAIYGRIWPCLHAFCLSCASEMAKCSLCALLSCICWCQGSGLTSLRRPAPRHSAMPCAACGSFLEGRSGRNSSSDCEVCRCTHAVGRIERVSRDPGLFISPATLQSYRSAPSTCYTRTIYIKPNAGVLCSSELPGAPGCRQSIPFPSVACSVPSVCPQLTRGVVL